MSVIKTNDISSVYFTKYNKCNTEDRFILENLYGNPIGCGTSDVPYVYLIEGADLVSKSQRNIFHLEVSLSWPSGCTIFDETEGDKRDTYEEYSRRGYVGVIRLFNKTKRYVFFDPKHYVVKIKDVITDKLIFENNSNNREKAVDNPDANHDDDDADEWNNSNGGGDHDDYVDDDKSDINDSYQNDIESVQDSIDSLLISKIGTDYMDTQRDYFNVSEICRRRQLPLHIVEEKIRKILNRIEINKTSGCWVSASRKDYKSCFWLALGGLRFNDIFHFPQFISPGSEAIFIKNKAILHSPLCEQVLGREHFYCCRPQHLKLGTSKENATHVKIRKSLDQLFDLSPGDMRKYAYHLYCLADLVQKQIFTVTRDEFDVLKRRKGNKILYVTDEENNTKFVETIGHPDMGEKEIRNGRGDGDVQNDMDNDDDDDDDDDMWSILKRSDNILDKYTKKLKNKLL